MRSAHGRRPSRAKLPGAPTPDLDHFAALRRRLLRA
jgi:hypothetical protein